ncbi:MAG TPA: ribonucleotide-diphosphate reductase subunit alpha, partial [Gemmatimonadota bacterium]|nr:ribonucleotide-diphosphate reductase subunit alpha [Gemmatimonadota bacterium]
VYREGSREGILVTDKGAAPKAEAEPTPRSQAAAAPRLKPRPRPAITSGVTERIRTGEGNLYITINEDEEGLSEVFASLGKAGGSAAAQSEAMCRLISLCLRSGLDPATIVKQLKGIGGPNPVWDNGELILSAPDAIGRALERYLERTGRASAAERRGNASAEAVTRAAATTQTFEGPGAMPARPMSSCPDCGSPVSHENACLVCKHCGWSRC